MTIDQALNVLAERTYDTKRDLERKNLQRRNQVVDIYGERQVVSSPGQAYFYVSISKDMVYLERFQFKLVFSGLALPLDVAASGTTTSESLEISNNTITPNPHSHSVIYNMSGVTVAAMTGRVTSVQISTPEDGYVNVTAAMDAQYGSTAWRDIQNKEGVILPSENLSVSFDVMEMACDLHGSNSAAAGIIAPGIRKVLITTSAPCNITLLNYLKYSHLNR